MAKLFSLEAISYQPNDPIIEELEKLFSQIKDKIDNVTFANNVDVLKSKEVERVVTLIRDRFNINLTLHLSYWKYYPAAVFIHHNAFLQSSSFDYKTLAKKAVLSNADAEELISDFERFMRFANKKEGHIDLKKARVYGYFSEIPVIGVFDFFNLIKEGMITSRELVATVLHEIGHVFTGFEYHHRLLKTNLTLMNVVDAINHKDYNTAKYLLITDLKISDIPDLELSSNKDRIDLAGSLAEALLNQMGSEFMVSYYESTSVEASADDFAARFYLSKELASGLFKIYKSVDRQFNPTGSKYSVLSSFLSFLFFTILIPIIGIIFAPNAAIFFVLFTVAQFMFALLLTNVEDPYDVPYDRLKRIAYNTINSLKDIKLPKELIQSQIETYELIMKMVNELESMPTFKDPFIMEYITKKLPFIRKKFQYKEMQQVIESLMNNELFVAAHKLNLS